MATVRGASVYWNGRRLGRITEGTITEPDAGENQLCEDGFVARSIGVTVASLQITSIIEVGATPITDISSRDYGDITVGPIGGKLWSSKMWCTESSGKWNHETGSCTGDWKFEGPKFKKTG